MLVHLLDFRARRFADVADKDLIRAASGLLLDVAPGEPFELGGLLHYLRVNYDLLVNSSTDLFSRLAIFKASFGCLINFRIFSMLYIDGFLTGIFIFDFEAVNFATFRFTEIWVLHLLRVVDGVWGHRGAYSCYVERGFILCAICA